MQFIAAAFFAAIGLFIGAFLFTGLSGAFSQLHESLQQGSSSYVRLYQSTNYQSQGASAGSALGTTSSGATAPSKKNDIVSVLGDLSNASRFEALLHTVQGAELFADGTTYTIFVPTDAAFVALPYETQVALNTMTREEKERFVMYHIVPQRLAAVTGGVMAGTTWTLSRDAMNYELRDTGGVVNNAHVVATHITDNGIIYLVDGILLPPEKRAEPYIY